MIRTQIYIPDDKYNELQLMASLGMGTFSALIREGIDEVIKKRKRVKILRKFDAIKDFSNLLKGGDKNLSKNIDHFLYVEPYENKIK